MSHAFGFPRGGFIGVDVFFCISGFLITGIMVRERERTGTISVREFYARRARRILPMAVLVLVVTDVMARVIFTTVRAHQTITDSLWAFGFMANLHFAAVGTSYFEANRPQSAIQQYWSLAVEEQFYLIWPAVLLLTFLLASRLPRKPSRGAVGVVATLMVVASFAFSVSFTKSNPTDAYFSAATRAWELGLGALTMLVRPSLLRRVSEQLRATGSWLGLGVIVVSAFVISPFTPFPGTAAVFPVVGTAVILALGPARNDVGTRWALGSRPALYVGDISYSLYLWHWPAVVFANAYFVKGSAAARLSAVIAAFVLSVITYRLVEEPIRHSLWLSRKPAGYTRDRLRLGAWIEDNQKIFVLAAAVLVVAVGLMTLEAIDSPTATSLTAADSNLGGDVTEADAASTPADPLAATIKASALAKSWGRLDPPLDALENAGAPEWIKDHCIDVRSNNEARCVYGAQDAPKLAVVLGDSVAVSYVPGLRNALVSGGYRIQLLTLGQCPMIDTPTKASEHSSGTNQPCVEHRSWVMHEVARLHPDLVVITNSFAFVDSLVDGGPKGDSANFTTWREGTERTLAALGTATPGRRVIIGAPPSSENLQSCVTVRSSPQDCDREVQSRWLGVRVAEKTAAEATGATYVDPLAWFCFRLTCPAVIGSTPVYWDGVHLTAAYSRSLAPQLSQALLAA